MSWAIEEYAEDAVKAYIASKLAGYVVKFSPETGSKELRAEPFAAQAQAGNVMLVRGQWNDAFLDEAESFPRGSLKDRIDGCSRAFAALIGKAERGAPQGGSRGTAETAITAARPPATSAGIAAPSIWAAIGGVRR